METKFYHELQGAFARYLTTVLGDRFKPQMVEDLLALVQAVQKGC